MYTWVFQIPACLKLATLDDLDLKASLCCVEERSLLRYICFFTVGFSNPKSSLSMNYLY